MKNFKFILAAAFALAALSCQKEETYNSYSETDQNLVPLILTTGEPTKTYIAGDGVDKDIYWSSDDKIMVYCDISPIGSTPYSDEFSMPANYTPAGTHARFEGNVYMRSNLIWAVYPSSAALQATEDGVLTVRLPSEQVSCDGSFDKGCNISISKSDISKLDYSIGLTHPKPVINGNVKFENVCSLLKFRIPSGVTNVTSVTISTDNDIAGDLQLDYTSNTPSFDGFVKESSTNIITMTGTFAENTDYYFVLAPVDISELNIYVNTTDKQYAATRTFSTPISFVAGSYKNLGTLNLANMPSLKVDFDVNDNGGVLNGTDVIFTFPSDDVSNLQLTVSSADKKFVRTISDTEPELTESMYISSCFSSELPYLPKGKYDVSGYYETSAGRAPVSGITFEITADDVPSFTVESLNAYTSYTKYSEYKKGTGTLNAANDCHGASIYLYNIKANVHSNILTNPIYASIIKAKFDGGNEIKSVSEEAGIYEFSMPAYGSYTSATLSFDDVWSTSSPCSLSDCYVTGIPYKLNSNGWSVSGNYKWTDNTLRLGYNLDNIASWGDGSAQISYELYTPFTIDVVVSSTGSVAGTKFIFTIKNTGSVSLDENKVWEVKNVGNETKPASGTKVLTVSPTKPKILISNSASINTACTIVNTLEIYYSAPKCKR